MIYDETHKATIREFPPEILFAKTSKIIANEVNQNSFFPPFRNFYEAFECESRRQNENGKSKKLEMLGIVYFYDLFAHRTI